MISKSQFVIFSALLASQGLVGAGGSTSDAQTAAADRSDSPVPAAAGAAPAVLAAQAAAAAKPAPPVAADLVEVLANQNIRLTKEKLSDLRAARKQHTWTTSTHLSKVAELKAVYDAVQAKADNLQKFKVAFDAFEVAKAASEKANAAATDAQAEAEKAETDSGKADAEAAQAKTRAVQARAQIKTAEESGAVVDDSLTRAQAQASAENQQKAKMAADARKALEDAKASFIKLQIASTQAATAAFQAGADLSSAHKLSGYKYTNPENLEKALKMSQEKAAAAKKNLEGAEAELTEIKKEAADVQQKTAESKAEAETLKKLLDNLAAEQKAEAEQKAKAEAEKKAKAEAEKKAKEEAEKKAKEEADKKTKEEADKKAKEEADKLKQEAEPKVEPAPVPAAPAKPATIPTFTAYEKKAVDDLTAGFVKTVLGDKPEKEKAENMTKTVKAAFNLNDRAQKLQKILTELIKSAAAQEKPAANTEAKNLRRLAEKAEDSKKEDPMVNVIRKTATEALTKLTGLQAKHGEKYEKVKNMDQYNIFLTEVNATEGAFARAEAVIKLRDDNNSKAAELKSAKATVLGLGLGLGLGIPVLVGVVFTVLVKTNRVLLNFGSTVSADV